MKMKLSELVKELKTCVNHDELSDNYLRSCNSATRENMPLVAEYEYGVTRVQAAVVLPFLELLLNNYNDFELEVGEEESD